MEKDMPQPEAIRNVLIVLSLVSFLGMLIRPFWGVVSYMMVMMLRPGLYIPILGQLRIELLIGLFVIGFIFISGRSSKITMGDNHSSKWRYII
jgi:hypothetical protein